MVYRCDECDLLKDDDVELMVDHPFNDKLICCESCSTELKPEGNEDE
jgi:predicted nucleic acid-binding Zn ribbon protein